MTVAEVGEPPGSLWAARVVGPCRALLEDTVSDTNVTIVGNVATEPQLKIVGGDIPRCSFRLACSTRRRDGDEWVDGPTSWYTVTAWRWLAENVSLSVFRGDPVVVTGRLQVREWSTDERSGTSVEIDAATIGHDMQRGKSRFTRVTQRPRPPAGEDGAAAVQDLSHGTVLSDGASPAPAAHAAHAGNAAEADEGRARADVHAPAVVA